MIRILVLILLALALGAYAAYALRLDSGYVLLSYREWVLETSLIGFALAVAALIFVLVYGTRLLLGAIHLPETIRSVLARRRSRRADQGFVDGLKLLLAGDAKKAEVALVRRAADHPAPELNYLFAARAAQQAGVLDRRDRYLSLARVQADNSAAVVLMEAELLATAGERVAAIERLQQLRAARPRHAATGAMLAEYLAAEGRWQELHELLQGSAKTLALSAARRQQLQQQAAVARLDAAGQSGRIDTVKSVWQSVPGALHGQVPVRNAHIRALVRANASAEAAAQIVKALSLDWDAELIALYGELDASDGIAQLSIIEQWLQRYGEKPELLLVAGRACLNNRLWGKARSYLDAAVNQRPTPQAYLQLARLCSQTQQPDDALDYYRKGLELRSS